MKNLVLTGFMGTGKSAIGRSVASTLDMAFLDMDDLIVARAGMSVAEIFDRQGEGAFRDLEAAIARELGTQDGLVIATGGGTMIRSDNRQALEANAVVICLTCTPEEIIRRLADDTSRPLLNCQDKEERVAELLAARMAVYSSLPVVIDTTGLAISEVAQSVIEQYRMEQCKLSTSA